jgi:hypothetical protein
MWDRAWKRPPTSEPRFRPRIGTALDLDDVQVIEDVQVIDARTRNFLSRVIAVGAGGAVAITGSYGLASGNYVAVGVVSAVAGPMCGALVTHYFGSAGKDFR